MEKKKKKGKKRKKKVNYPPFQRPTASFHSILCHIMWRPPSSGYFHLQGQVRGVRKNSVEKKKSLEGQKLAGEETTFE